MGDAASGIQRKHAGGNALQNGFDVPAALLQSHVGSAEFTAGCFDLAAADSNSSAIRLNDRTKSPISSAALTSTR